MLVGHDHGAEVRQAAEEGADPLDPLGVDEGHLGARVLEPVAQLLAAPPGVQRDHDGAGQRGAPEGHDPLGQVPHDDGDAVALFDPEGGAQPVGQGAGDAVVLGEGRPLVLVDEEDVVAVAERHVDDGAQRGRRVLPDAGRHPADVELLHLEELPGGGERCIGVRDRHRRRVLAGGAHVPSFSLRSRCASGGVEDRPAVVGQLRHGLADVLQRPVAALLLGGRLVDVGEPAPAELLDGGDVDGAVVQEVLDLGELHRQEAPVGPDGVPGQGDLARLGNVRLQEGQGLGPGVGEAERRRLDLGQEARAGVHGAHDVVHVRQLLRRGVHHQVGALLDELQVVVGDEAGDLDDGVARRIEPRHLEIDPGQHAGTLAVGPGAGGWPRPL